jgi:hypothetical protein
MQTSNEEYLNKEIRPLLEALAQAVITEQPEDAVSICI